MTHRAEYSGCDFFDEDEHELCVCKHTEVATRAWDFVYQFVVLLVLYLAIFSLTRLDDFHEMENTPKDKLVDAAATLFPHIAAGPAHSTLPAAAFVDGRPDIRSFGYDLGARMFSRRSWAC
jgi:hypothetical protein